jgi:hypothetical protein
VKAFNDIYVTHLGSLQRPAGHSDRPVLAIARNGGAAKPTVTECLDSIGYDAHDVARCPRAGLPARHRCLRPALRDPRRRVAHVDRTAGDTGDADREAGRSRALPGYVR